MTQTFTIPGEMTVSLNGGGASFHNDSRDSILSEFDMDESDALDSFFNERVFAAHFWELASHGLSDGEYETGSGNRVFLFHITESDIEIFPELGDVSTLAVWRDSAGNIWAIDSE